MRQESVGKQDDPCHTAWTIIQLHHDQATDLCLVLDLMWNHFCKMEFRSIRISDPKTSCPSCKLRNRQKWKLNKISLQKEIFMGGGGGRHKNIGKWLFLSFCNCCWVCIKSENHISIICMCGFKSAIQYSSLPT